MRKRLSVVNRKGQMTLAAEICRSLGIKQEDKVATSWGDSEEAPVIQRPIRSVAEAAFGTIKPRRRPEDFQEPRHRFEEVLAEVPPEEP